MKWIKSTDQLPEFKQRCIVAWADQHVPHTATYHEDKLRGGGFYWLASNGNLPPAVLDALPRNATEGRSMTWPFPQHPLPPYREPKNPAPKYPTDTEDAPL